MAKLILVLLVLMPALFTVVLNQEPEIDAQIDPVSTTTERPNQIRNRITAEKKLRDKLFTLDQYDRKVRPSGNKTDTVSIYISMRLIHIEGIDEQRQLIKLHTWTGLQWNDVRLKWDSEAYANLTTLHTPEEDIWLPDVALYNNAEGKDTQNFGATSALIQANGDVLWIPPASYSAQCNMSFDAWPYDKHRCHLVIGSWTQHGWDLDLQLADKSATIDQSNYVENDKWTLVNVSAARSEVIYPCCVEPYISLTFSVEVKRNPSHYFWTLVYPANVLLLASWFLFLLPDNKIRLIIGLIEMLALCGESVFLWIVVPPTFGTPRIVQLVSRSIGMIFYALLLCLGLDKIDCTKRQAPAWIRNMFNPKLAGLFGVSATSMFRPKRMTHRRGEGVDNDKELLTVEYDREPELEGNGYHLNIDGGATSNGNSAALVQHPDNSWKIFSDILSRIFLIHYAILTIVIIALFT